MIDLSGDSYRDPPGGFAPAHHANCLAAAAYQTPYALVSQSLGPFRAINEPLVRYCLSHAELVYIRERRTQELLLRIGVPPERLQLAPDVAFALPRVPADAILTAERLDLDRLHRPWVGVSVSHLALRLADARGQNRYLEEMARAVDHVHRRYGATVFLIPHEVNPAYYGTDDRTAAEALFQRMGSPDWLHRIRGDHDPSTLKGLIGECDALIASRMHAAIAGLSSGVPTIVVSWSHKYYGLMEEIGLGGCLWDQNAPVHDSLSALFDRMWQQRDSARDLLLAYTARARLEIDGMMRRIAACIPGNTATDAAPQPRRPHLKRRAG